MFSFLSNLLPSYFKPRSEHELKSPRVKYGFNTRVDLGYQDALGQTTGSRPGAYMSNEFSLFGIVEGRIVNEVPINDGWRKDIMDTDGRVDSGLVELALRQSAIDKRDANKVVDYFKTVDCGSNVTSLFYNLLRLYYIKKYENVVYKPKDNFYDNGHIKILNAQMFINSGDEGKLGSAVNITEGNVSNMLFTWRDDLESVPDCSVAWNGHMTNIEYWIIKKAIGEWRQTRPFAVAHSSPSLTKMLHVATSGMISRGDAENPKYTCGDVMRVIDKLVTANRYYTDFSYAYFMICQLLVLPIPRSAEAAAWFVGSQSVAMPLLIANGGLCSMLRTGVPYRREADWMDSFIMWKKTPAMALFHSMAVNEAVYIEMGNIMRINESDEINHRTFTEVSMAGTPINKGGLLTDLTLIAMRYNQKIDMPYAVSCGLSRMEDLNAVVNIKVPVIITDIDAPSYYGLTGTSFTVGMESELVITSYTPALYPILTYGINVDSFYANGMDESVSTSVLSRESGVITFDDPVAFAKFMNITRIMGYDVKAKERHSGKVTVNWSDNASGRFLYTDIHEVYMPLYDIIISDIKERANCWIKVGSFIGDITLNFKMTGMRARVYNGSAELQMLGTVIDNAKPTPIVHRAQEIRASADRVTIMALQRMPSDFRLARYYLPGLSGSQTVISTRPNVQMHGQADQEPIVPVELPDDPGGHAASESSVDI